MLPAGRAWGREDARAARERCDARNERLARASTRAAPQVTAREQRERRQAAVAAALARARARRAAYRGGPE
jgi:hypothetical protein